MWRENAPPSLTLEEFARVEAALAQVYRQVYQAYTLDGVRVEANPATGQLTVDLRQGDCWVRCVTEP